MAPFSLPLELKLEICGHVSTVPGSLHARVSGIHIRSIGSISTDTMAPPAPASLFTLPCELRLKIYGYVFTQPSPLHARTGCVTFAHRRVKHRTALLQTCRLLSSEAKPVLFKATTSLVVPLCDPRNAFRKGTDRSKKPILKLDFGNIHQCRPHVVIDLIKRLPNLKYIDVWVRWEILNARYLYDGVRGKDWTRIEGLLCHGTCSHTPEAFCKHRHETEEGFQYRLLEVEKLVPKPKA